MPELGAAEIPGIRRDGSRPLRVCLYCLRLRLLDAERQSTLHLPDRINEAHGGRALLRG